MPKKFKRAVNAEVKKKLVRMTFITNNFEWSANSICELYKARWGIEVFFQQIKQNLQATDFLGNNENAVRWQIWIALLAYLPLRFIEFIAKWKKTFFKLFTLVRGSCGSVSTSSAFSNPVGQQPPN